MRVELKRGTLNDLFTLKELVSMNYIDTCDKDITQAYITEYIDKTFTIPKLSKELTREDSLFYLLYVDKKLVGYTKLNKYEAQLDIKSPKSLEIEKIYILKYYQSKGLGKILLNEIIRIAKNDNKEFIWSGVLEKNKNAISFYNKNGFKQIGRFPFKVENYIKTGFIMQRDIK